jgi:catechol 2,3-dioxygenase-like lactoylglutathione lyase family enzyme
MARLHEVELFVADIARALSPYRDVIGVPLEGHRHAEGEPVHYHATWGSGANFLLFSVYVLAACLCEAGIAGFGGAH